MFDNFQGNVDTELGTAGQSFDAAVTGDVGNFNSENLPFVQGGMTANGRDMFDRYFRDVNARLAEQRQGGGDKLDYYAQLGQQLMQALGGGPQQQAAEAGNPYGGDLTGGFEADWLNQRLSAGSANGAKIGGMKK